MKYVFFALALMFSVQSFAGTAQNTIDWLEANRSGNEVVNGSWTVDSPEERIVNFNGKKYKCTEGYNNEINCRTT